jgi:hypothetical protein
MTTPGTPASHGRPLLETAAESAINAARERAGIGQQSRFPFPQRHKLTDAERRDATEAAKTACQLCGGLHAGPNTPACPRIRTFERDGDGKVVKGEFWQDGQYDAARILFVADALDDEDGESDDSGQPGTP